MSMSELKFSSSAPNFPIPITTNRAGRRVPSGWSATGAPRRASSARREKRIAPSRAADASRERSSVTSGRGATPERSRAAIRATSRCFIRRRSRLSSSSVAHRSAAARASLPSASGPGRRSTPSSRKRNSKISGRLAICSGMNSEPPSNAPISGRRSSRANTRFRKAPGRESTHRDRLRKKRSGSGAEEAARQMRSHPACSRGRRCRRSESSDSTRAVSRTPISRRRSAVGPFFPARGIGFNGRVSGGRRRRAG